MSAVLKMAVKLNQSLAHCFGDPNRISLKHGNGVEGVPVAEHRPNSSTHYSDVIMGAMASQITGVTNVYLTVCLGTDQRKRQISASLAFVRGIHR